MKLKLLNLVSLSFVYLIPLTSFAASPTDFKSFMARLISIVDSFVPPVVAFSVFAFMWGIFFYVRAISTGDDKEIQKFKEYLVWNSIAMFLLFSVWAVVELFLFVAFGDEVLNNYPSINRDLPTIDRSQ